MLILYYPNPEPNPNPNLISLHGTQTQNLIHPNQPKPLSQTLNVIPNPIPNSETQPTRNPNPLVAPQTPRRVFGTGGATDRAGGLPPGKVYLAKIYLNPYTLIGARPVHDQT